MRWKPQTQEILKLCSSAMMEPRNGTEVEGGPPLEQPIVQIKIKKSNLFLLEFKILQKGKTFLI